MPPSPPATSATDVTDAALRASEVRYRRLFEAAQDGILLINAETAQIEDANPYLMRMLGYTHAALLGRKLWEVGAFADADKSADMFAQLQATGYVRYDDLPLRTHAGALINVEFVSNAYDCDGVRVIQCNIRNITAQRRAEEQARELALVVAQSPVGIVITDPQGVIEYVNEALLHDSGYGRDELIGLPVRRLHAGAMPPQALAEVRAALDQGRTWQGEFLSRRKDGSVFTESAIVAPIHAADGATRHHVSFTQDLTQRQRDAEELAQHRDRLEELVDQRTRELAAATQAARAANVAKSAFLANMSHEIRTPLVAITGMAYLIRRSKLTPQQSAWLSKLEAGGQHLLELVNAVLDLSKIDAGKLALDEAPVDLGAIATGVAALLSGQARDKQLTLQVEVQASALALVGDAMRLQQCLLNYAGNAIKFTETGGVTLRVACTDDAADSALVRFEVQDSGVGIAAAVLPRLFAAFEQADNSSTRRYGGSGLGLAIVGQLSRLMGGEVGVRSEPGVGSTFWFTARLHKAEHLPPANVIRPQDAAATLKRWHHDARVLLVDDEPVSREVTQELLRTVVTHVDTAEDGQEALELVERHGYDLVLMDVHMPRVDGIEATRRIRVMPLRAGTPIVALTASAFVEDIQRCRDAGMDDVLSKPFNPEALFDMLVRWLSRAPMRP